MDQMLLALLHQLEIYATLMEAVFTEMGAQEEALADIIMIAVVVIVHLVVVQMEEMVEDMIFIQKVAEAKVLLQDILENLMALYMQEAVVEVALILKAQDLVAKAEEVMEEMEEELAVLLELLIQVAVVEEELEVLVTAVVAELEALVSASSVGLKIIYLNLFYESSSTFTVPKGVKKIDVFCVGGGGGSGYNDDSDRPYLSSGGAGGGYTSTVLDVDVSEGQELSVVVGSGGIAGYFYNWYGDHYMGSVSPTAGGASSVGDVCSANGGNSSKNYSGGDGGSGGGVSFNTSTSASFIYVYGTAGGIDGSDGGSFSFGGVTNNGGTGQGTTTRYFGESNGTLYSTGGCGGQYGLFSINDSLWYQNANSNTGNGDSGASFCSFNGKTLINCISVGGASGICIIRWGK